MIDLYSQMLIMKVGSASEARRMAEEWVDRAKAQAEAEGTLNVSGAADLYFRNAQSDPALRAKLQAKRADGVTDADVRTWWNLHDLERRMVILEDENSRIAFIMWKTQEQGLSVEQAAAELRRFSPIYGDPTDTQHATGDDRPLPFELKDRVNCWIQKQMPDPEGFKARLAKASSYNALVRAEVRNGKL